MTRDHWEDMDWSDRFDALGWDDDDQLDLLYAILTKRESTPMFDWYTWLHRETRAMRQVYLDQIANEDTTANRADEVER